jgi:diaminobutyrate-2-oxoglutarate transaminase
MRDLTAHKVCEHAAAMGERLSEHLRFLPPLVITAAEIDRVAEIFGRAMTAATVSL